MTVAIWIVWFLLLVLAVFYVARIRHPKEKPVAAYMIFVLVFSAAAFVLFAALTWGLEAADQSVLLERPMTAAGLILLVFVLSFALATWQVRRPPRRPPRI